MGEKPIVFVVGATGMLGREIVKALVRRGEAEVRVAYRKPEDARKLRELGAAPIEADALQPSTLQRALRGVDVVVSAVGNVPKVQVDGQKNLITAAKEAGVKRFIPPDFSIDFFKLDRGDNFNLDMRKEVNEALEASGVPATHVLNGAFMDVMLGDGAGLVDREAGTFSFYGDGEEPGDYTSVGDTARFVAAVATDPTRHPSCGSPVTC